MAPRFFRHVDETILSRLQQRLEQNGRLSRDFLVLLAGATAIATLGLFQNSPAVIIGAMIIAPLMRPLTCLSLAMITADARQLVKSVLTLLVGSVLGIVISTTMAWLLRALELTPEILARTHPTLLDLGVALAAGAVGAYCQADEKLSDTMAGVAIAVALVPPLSVVGIGLAFDSPSVSFGAALLYATNLVGITIAGSLVFLLQGFSPLKLARRGLAISGVCILMLGVPLALSMRELILENQISAKVKTVLKEKTVTFRDAQLREVKVTRFKVPMTVKATVLSSGDTITPRQVTLVQDLLIKEIGLPLKFALRIIPATEVTALDVSPGGETRVMTPLSNSADFGSDIDLPAAEQAGPSPEPNSENSGPQEKSATGAPELKTSEPTEVKGSQNKEGLDSVTGDPAAEEADRLAPAPQKESAVEAHGIKK
ncbi:MAG: TIGR00341 family protein [Candidatus Obscuribacter sp.]|nr:TIGR00341 family protein [Candidatus Obscuribacter sp.]